MMAGKNKVKTAFSSALRAVACVRFLTAPRTVGVSVQMSSVQEPITNLADYIAEINKKAEKKVTESPLPSTCRSNGAQGCRGR